MKLLNDRHRVAKTNKIVQEPDNRLMLLEKYFKFMFVRDPLERLISAYRNKCWNKLDCRLRTLQTYRSRRKGETAKYFTQNQLAKRASSEAKKKKLL